MTDTSVSNPLACALKVANRSSIELMQNDTPSLANFLQNQNFDTSQPSSQMDVSENINSSTAVVGLIGLAPTNGRSVLKSAENESDFQYSTVPSSRLSICEEMLQTSHHSHIGATDMETVINGPTSNSDNPSHTPLDDSDFNAHGCEQFDLLSSPPTSSPPQLFSSSQPSSQSSAVDSIEYITVSKGIPEDLVDFLGEDIPFVTPNSPESGSRVFTASPPPVLDVTASKEMDDLALVSKSPLGTFSVPPSPVAVFTSSERALVTVVQLRLAMDIKPAMTSPSVSLGAPLASSPQSASGSPQKDTGTFGIRNPDTTLRGVNTCNGSSGFEKSSNLTHGSLMDVFPELVGAELSSSDLQSTSLLGKRKAEDEDVDQRQLQPIYRQPDPTDGVTTRKFLPNPKRSTIAAQKLQHKKLTSPFRSPALIRPKSETVHTTAIPKILSPHPKPLLIEEPAESPSPEIADTKKRYRTQRAASPFKSPLSLDTSSKLVPSVRMTPSIQALERKLQLLKRAVKIKEDSEENTLMGLIKKWTEAGREVAWEVWELVKNSSNSEESWNKPQMKSHRAPALEDSWGWSDASAKADTPYGNDRNWGWDVMPIEAAPATIDVDMAENPKRTGHSKSEDDDYMDESKQDTLGTMLLQLGIAPETLNWNEEEGTFQDE